MREVLDPEQNATFRDNYLGVPYDLSRVAFIATANMLDTVPGPLRDRMEIISLAGYTDGEKLEIARRYLAPRQLEANGLKPGQVEIEDEALRRIIRDYTREAGVRSLEREIGRALRHAAVQIAEGSVGDLRIGADDLPAIMGPPRFEDELAMRTSLPGVATGLAWTPVGGDILFIEAARSPGRGALVLTGQLGEVMGESAQAAMTLVKSRAESFGIAPEASLTRRFFRSAGSRLCNRPHCPTSPRGSARRQRRWRLPGCSIARPTSFSSPAPPPSRICAKISPRPNARCRSTRSRNWTLWRVPPPPEEKGQPGPLCRQAPRKKATRSET